jgi:PAS domain S-box-containing protein
MGKAGFTLEEKLNLLVDASAALLQSIHQETPVPAILRLAQHLNSADACALWRFDTASSVWRITASSGLSEKTPCASVPGTCTEFPKHGRARRLREERMSSEIVLHLRIAESPAALAMYYRERRRLSRTERDAAGALAHLAGVAIETSELLARNRVMMEVALKALREREERMQMAMDVGRVGMWEWDLTTGRMLCCERFRSIHGLGAGEWDGRYETLLRSLHPDDRAAFEAAIARAFGQRSTLDHEYRILISSGEERWIATSGRVICDDTDRPVRWVAVDRDVTWRRQLERKVGEAQQMESVALLAAGVAHKFNNLLTGIMGNASVAAGMMSGAGLTREPLDNVVHAARRAAYLTRQLLAYSGQGMVTIGKLNISRLVAESAEFFRASAPPNVEVDLNLASDPPAVEGDAALIEQAILNLLVNASEAIGDKPGTIALRTGEAIDCTGPNGETGRCVYLEVIDTGCGMDAATQTRIFDPFFSTKFIGRGLGLAAVSGIVRRHGGSISVVSELSKGSTFHIILPAARDQAGQPGKASETAA